MRQCGGYAGTLDATDGNIETITLPGAWRANGGEWDRSQLVFPDASSANRVRSVTSMENGRAGIASRAAVAEGERYELYTEDLSEGEVNDAISQTLNQTLRPVAFQIPANGRLLYEMPDWLTDWRNIRAVHVGTSPGVIANEDFSSWVHGTHAAPTSWEAIVTAAGAATSGRGAGGVRLDTAGGGITLRQRIQLARGQSERRLSLLIDATGHGADYEVHSGHNNFILGTAASSHARTESTLDVVVPVEADDVTVDLVVSVSGTSVTVHRVLGQWGAKLNDQYRRLGSQSFHSDVLTRWRPVTGRVHPAIEIDYERSGEQLKVHALAPFPDATTDEEESDAAVDLLMHGAIFKLADREVAGRDASVWDRRATKHGRAYEERATRLRQDPVPDPVRPRVVRGA